MSIFKGLASSIINERDFLYLNISYNANFQQFDEWEIRSCATSLSSYNITFVLQETNEIHFIELINFWAIWMF